MSTIYFTSLAPLPSDVLRKLSRPEDLEGYHALPPPLQRALVFGWQWEQGQASFSISTSGSTGPPKTIKIIRQQMVASVRNTQQALRLTSKHTALLCIDSAYIGGMMVLARALEINMDVVVVVPSAHLSSKLSPQPNLLALVPLQLQAIMNEDSTLLRDKHAILVGGAPVSPALEEDIRKRINTPVYSTYGMTETASHVALRRINGPDTSDTFRVLGDTQVGTDARGCLTITGAVTNHERVVTNDRVVLVDERHFRWLGRHDWVINSGGIKVSPEPVERVAAAQWLAPPHPPLLVVGLPDERLGQRVVLVVEGHPAPEAEQQQLLQRVAAAVPPYHAPRAVCYLTKIPQTPGGKPDRPETIKELLRTIT